MLIFIYILETLIYIYFALGCSFKINLNQFEHPNILSIIRVYNKVKAPNRCTGSKTRALAK